MWNIEKMRGGGQKSPSFNIFLETLETQFDQYVGTVSSKCDENMIIQTYHVLQLHTYIFKTM